MGNVVVEVKNLEKQYGKQKAVKDMSFRIEQGMICGLIGPNGAGKTTIMKMLGGLVLPTQGEIALFGEHSEEGLANARQRMGFIIETPYAKEKLSARENLEKMCLQRGITEKERIDEALELVGLKDTGKKEVRKFSLGMRQRLGIANILLCRSEIMVLDEPINGLDPEGIVEIRELFLKLNREEHITFLISSHILSELSMLCTDYLFVLRGELVQAVSASELKNHCKEYFYIHTDRDAEAFRVLKNRLGITEMELNEDGSIRLYERLDQIREISKTLFEQGVIPLELRSCEANLEKYYMDMAGEHYAEHH